MAPSAVVIVANASRQRPAWASLRSWAKPSVTFGFRARGTWFGGRLCLLAGGFCGGFGGRRCGGVRATVLTSRSMYAGDMVRRVAAALACELAPLSQAWLRYGVRPALRCELCAPEGLQMHAQSCRAASGAAVCGTALSRAQVLASVLHAASTTRVQPRAAGLDAQAKSTKVKHCDITNPIHDRFASMARVLLSA